MITSVFVYGTLRKGQRNSFMMDAAVFKGTTSTEPRFELVDLGTFPGIIDGERSIIGELYEANEKLIDVIDEFERCPILYVRCLTKTELGDAWVYKYNEPLDKPIFIASGDWLNP